MLKFFSSPPPQICSDRRVTKCNRSVCRLQIEWAVDFRASESDSDGLVELEVTTRQFLALFSLVLPFLPIGRQEITCAFLVFVQLSRALNFGAVRCRRLRLHPRRRPGPGYGGKGSVFGTFSKLSVNHYRVQSFILRQHSLSELGLGPGNALVGLLRNSCVLRVLLRVRCLLHQQIEGGGRALGTLSASSPCGLAV